MAKLNILPRKKFEIVLENGQVIQGQFGTYALALHETGLKNKKDVAESALYGAANILLCAVEQAYRNEGNKNFVYEAYDAFNWIDELGGADGEDCKALFDHILEKKSDTITPKTPTLTSTTSSESQEAAA